MIDVWEIPIPPTARVLPVHLSLLTPPSSLPQSLPLWCYLWVCVSVGRRWRSVWLNPDKETNSSANRHRRGREDGGVGGGGDDGSGGWRGSAQNKTDKRQNAKTLLKHQAMGVLLNSKPPPSSFQTPKTHTCRHTTSSDSAGSTGAPVLHILIHTHTQDSEDGGPDIWSILILINWWDNVTKKKAKGLTIFLYAGHFH